MRWEKLAFLHWRYPAEEIQRRLPSGLSVDRFDGEAWIGVVPFLMNRVRLRGLFPVPGTARFPELNVRTYVTDGEKPGVWFFSLDAANRLAVRGARSLFHLPYFDARMRITDRHGVEYQSERTHRGEPPARFRGRYRAVGSTFRAPAGTLERWLTDRYCLYAGDRSGRAWRGEVDHEPWHLAPGEAEIETNELFRGDGLPEVRGAPLVHAADPLDVVAWSLERVT